MVYWNDKDFLKKLSPHPHVIQINGNVFRNNIFYQRNLFISGSYITFSCLGNFIVTDSITS